MTLPGTPVLEIKDFTGGQTDNVIGRPVNLSATLKNFYIDVDGSIKVRPGSSPDGGTDTLCKISSGVEHLIRSLSSGDKPYKLTTGSSKGKLFYFNGTTHAELVGPSGNSMFTTAHGGATDHRFIHSRWNDQLFITTTSLTERMKRVFLNVAGTLCLRTVGLPKFDGTTTYTTAGTAGSYIYAFVWKHTFTSGTRTFVDRSAPFYETKANIYGNVKGTAGTLVNSGGESYYATAAAGSESLVLEIYRTVNAGTVFYLVGSVDYAALATGVTDGIADATLVNNTTLYITDGSAPRDQPPISKFFHVTESGVGLYAHIYDGTDVFKNRVGQSLPGIPNARPGNFFDDTNEEVTGVSSFRDVPIVFCTNSIYRGEGQFTTTGEGEFKLKKVVDGIGCINHNSIVQTFVGVFFAGSSGFYWTDGYTVTKLSDELNDTYSTAFSTAARQRACNGAFDEINLRVLWTALETSTADQLFVFHLRQGIKPNAAFAIWGGFTETTHPESNIWPATVPLTITDNYQAKGLLWADGSLYRGDSRGYTFLFDSAMKTDPRVDTSLATYSSWGTTYIAYDWESVAIDFGAGLVRKWTPSVELIVKARGNISVRPRIDRDLEDNVKQCREIKEVSEVTWGQAGILWGDPALWSSERALRLFQRRFPARGLRCTYRTVGFANSFTILYKSDSFALGTLNHAAKTLLLAAGSWPTDLLDYYVSFEGDNYTDKFLITVRSASTLTLSDATGRLPINGTYKWQIHGYAKGNVLNVQAVNLPYTMITDSQRLYRAGEEGGNAES